MRRVLLAVVVFLASTAAAQQQVQPTITLTPDCIQDRPRAWTITATGRMPYQGVTVYVVFDYQGSNPRTFTTSVNNNFQYTVNMSIPTGSYAGASWRVAAYQTEPDGGIVAFAETRFRSPCTTTTSSSDTTTSTTSTSTTTSTTSTTTTTTTTVPPSPVPVLKVTPAVGPPGFVTTATGAGFPPGPVALDWDRGIGGAIAVADAAGTFSVPVPILRKDVLGPRVLTAVGGAASASTTFLVVPASVQPNRFVFRG